MLARKRLLEIRLRFGGDTPSLGAPGPLPQRTCAQQFFRGLPEAEWSSELNAKLLEIAHTKVAMYDAYISEMEQMPWDVTYLQQHRSSFGTRPIRVLTSGNHGVGHLEMKPADTPEHVKYEQEATLAQGALAGTLVERQANIRAPQLGIHPIRRAADGNHRDSGRF